MAEHAHQECPYETCGSSDAFSYNDEGYGKCHACNQGYPSSRKTFDWAKEKYPTKGESMSFTPKAVVSYHEDTPSNGKYEALRGINTRTMEDYGVYTYKDVNWSVKIKDSWESGVSDEVRFTYPNGSNKLRRLDLSKDHKGHFSVTKGFSADCLFGMNLFTAGSSKMITITEGELDALSVAQMMKSTYTNPVVSLPSATPSKKLWENCSDWLNSFDKIILSLDTDEAGNAMADKIAKLFPNKVYRVNHHPYKDANDFLQNGKVKEFKGAWWSASKYTPDNVMNTTEDFLALYQDAPEHEYVPTGIQALDDKILGLMQGHFTVIKAPTGIGKTEVMRYLEYNMIKRGVPIAAMHVEETKLRSLLGLVSYECNDNLTRRDLIEEKDANEQVMQAIQTLTKDELYYQFFMGDGQGAEELCEQIRYFSQACGCKFVFFEPIQDVVVGSSEEGKESMLADLAIRLSKLAAELNVGIVTIAHTNDNGDPKYCKMIGQRASVVIDLSREKEADSLEERNTTHIRVEKNRPCSEEGNAGTMRFNLDTFTLREV